MQRSFISSLTSSKMISSIVIPRKADEPLLPECIVAVGRIDTIDNNFPTLLCSSEMIYVFVHESVPWSDIVLDSPIEAR